MGERILLRPGAALDINEVRARPNVWYCTSQGVGEQVDTVTRVTGVVRWEERNYVTPG